ncbi:energy-coupling factor ABC transporter ATP-binding protein [Fructilactobacillus myrtifloralis]|uniref:Energy-coupling factor ABC transporter ATP-binding protein n=1 Tax=Fructilactobacillus myrtifloralis TaxID=2940301 RepID=A0ABY5BLT9_9LACO|nr:ABC transporter ATP-binding protein [Fructilactobacillus myrtifloralis]USS84587.1 energy-coupling factor ABC transporter ATP-binding protein [Fructilactobacillus myrtifloralis]
MQTAVTLHHFSFKYPNQTEPLFHDVQLEIPTGQFWLLSGPSGCGKSTLLELVAGLSDQKYQGEIALNQQSLAQLPAPERSKLVNLMLQDPNQQFVMQTVAGELQFALENQQTDPAQIPERIRAALAFCQIEHLADRQVLSLSGGEKQKAILATMVALDSAIFLLDEPFASVDPQSKRDILQHLQQLQTERGKTIIVSDHDLTGYQDLVDHVVTVAPETHELKLLSSAAQTELFAKRQQPTQRFAMPAPETGLFWLQDYQISYGNSTLLSVPELQIPAGCTLLTGPSGSGKSTLLRSLSKLQKYTGQITLNQRNIQTIKNKRYYDQLGLVFQAAPDQFLRVTVAEELELSLATSQCSTWNKEAVQQALARLQLTGHEQQSVYTLSGGQQKKLQILVMLIRHSHILLLDEPFAGLDQASIATVQTLLKQQYQGPDHLLLVISHQRFATPGFYDYHLHLTNHTFTYQEVD